MNTTIKYQGDDIPITVELTDSAGTPINITNLAELYVYVINHKQNSILAQFSKAGGGAFQSLKVVTAFKYRADVLSGTTKNAPIGMYDVDINVVQTDADYQSNQKNTIGLKCVFDLYKSVSKIVSSG
jgi:hypothetical protein